MHSVAVVRSGQKEDEMVAKQERRNETIQVKVTPTERQQLERVADHAKVSLSEAGRRAIVRDLAKGGRPGKDAD
jgi:hypothetical protein